MSRKLFSNKDCALADLNTQIHFFCFTVDLLYMSEMQHELNMKKIHQGGWNLLLRIGLQLTDEEPSKEFLLQANSEFHKYSCILFQGSH